MFFQNLMSTMVSLLPIPHRTMTGATKQQRGIHKDTLHQPQHTNSLRDTGDNTTQMTAGFNGEPAVKLYAKNVKVGTSANGNSRKDQDTMGWVDSPWIC